MATPGAETMIMGGVVVKFPYKPYPPQKAMMSKIIRALSSGENALLESPTGSGKSLSLLCSALAWQKNECNKLAKKEEEERMKVMTCTCKCHVKAEDAGSATYHVPTPQPPHSTLITTSTITASTISAGTSQSPIIIPSSSPVTAGSAEPGKSAPHIASTCVKGEATPLPGVKLPAMLLKNSDLLGVLESAAGNQGAQMGEGSVIERSKASTEEVKAKTKKIESGVKVEPDAMSAEASAAGQNHKDMGDEDDDFKPSKKRFRHPIPVKAGPCVKKLKTAASKAKGIVYEEEEENAELAPHDNGHAKWKMEFNTPGGVAPGIGIPQSQIMDTGPLDNSLPGGVKPITYTSSKAAFVSPVLHIHQDCKQCNCAETSVRLTSPDRAYNRGYPKIYFATRTHKQITQIVRELNKSAYNDVPMCILASREHTCIHPKVRQSKTKNDDCRALLDYDKGVSCSFYHRVQQKMGSQAQIRQLGLDKAWDIEDLVKLGNKVKACPYFACRGIVEEADIVFCPYNYLIDPLIRDQMLIDVVQKVIILDEAHNIEDSARDAASLTITSDELTEVTEEIAEIVPLTRVHTHTYQQLNSLITAILRWISYIEPTLQSRGYEQSFGVWSGSEFLTILNNHFGMTETTLEAYKKNLAAATEAALDKNNDQFQGEKRMPPEPTLSTMSLNRIKSVLMVMTYIFKEKGKYLEDYRLSLVKTVAMRQNNGSSTWHKKGRRRSLEKVWVYTLNFWCQNPAVAFKDLACSRSIILTSGTLSPLTSFASELGLTFPIQLETNHVISESQTWVRSISQGPNRVSLSATYQNSETFEFKDELGQLVLGICETVPFGVLCFMSSYKMLEKLSTRWQETGVWDRVSYHKCVVSEPRTGGKEAFDEVMATFYQEVTEAEERSTSGGQCGFGPQRTGALFLAVCRGKVSEGLDFSDNNARAVITIGIPFPAIMNKQIELKREYNDQHCRQRGLLSGKEWYEIQAYRALNQALGRCIRHKKDWGALILVDARYAKGAHYTKGLSKWVRQRVRHEGNFQQSIVSLKSFVECMLREDSMDTSVNDSKSSISVLEKSPTSLSVSVASSMHSPPPPAASSHAPFLSAGPSASLFVIDSPESAIPERFQVTPPKPVCKREPVTSTPTSLSPRLCRQEGSEGVALPNGPRLCRQDSGGVAPPPTNVRTARDGCKYPELMQMNEILELEIALEQEFAECAQSRPPAHRTSAVVSQETRVAATVITDSAPPGDTGVALVGGRGESICDADSTIIYTSHNGHPNDHKAPPPSPGNATPFSKAPPPPVPVSLHLASRATPPVIPDTPPVGSPVLFEALPSEMDFDLGGFESKDTSPYQTENSPDDNEELDSDATPPVSVAKVQGVIQHRKDTPSKCDGGVTLGTSEVVTPPPSKKRNVRKSTRKKSSALENGRGSNAVKCSCGEMITCSGERLELKHALTKLYGQCKVKLLLSSKLWTILKGGKKLMNVLLVSASELEFSLKEGCDDQYNCVWEEALGLCYSVLLCHGGCKRVIGVLIHATTSPAKPHQLVGKAILALETLTHDSTAATC